MCRGSKEGRATAGSIGRMRALLGAMIACLIALLVSSLHYYDSISFCSPTRSLVLQSNSLALSLRIESGSFPKPCGHKACSGHYPLYSSSLRLQPRLFL